VSEQPARIGYRILWMPHTDGTVEIRLWPRAQEGADGWYPSEQEARLTVARQMSSLADTLIDRANRINRDPMADY
jgi:hypothetical protein